MIEIASINIMGTLFSKELLADKLITTEQLADLVRPPVLLNSAGEPLPTQPDLRAVIIDKLNIARMAFQIVGAN